MWHETCIPWTDEQLRLIPETGGEVSTWDIMFAKAGRSLGPIRAMLDEDYKADPRYSLMRSDPARKTDPLRTATTGFNISKNANMVEKEANRLQIKPYELYRRIKFGPADVEVRKLVSQELPDKMLGFIRGESYKRLNDENKRKFFREKAREIVSGISSTVLVTLGTKIERFIKQNPDATKSEIEDKFGYTNNTLLKHMYETEISQENRTALESEIGPPKEDSNYTEYLIKGRNKSKQKLAQGGLVDTIINPEDQIEDDTTRQMTGLALDLAPVTGEIRSAQAAVEDFEKGDYGMSALSALGAVPILGIAGRVAKKAIKMAVNVKKDKKADIDYAELIISGDKKFETRNTPSLNSYIGKHVGIAKTGDGEAKAIGSVKIGEPIEVDEKTFRKLQEQHLVPQGSEFDIQPGGTKWLYPLSNPEKFDAPKSVGRGIVARKILDDVDEAKSMLGNEDAIKAWKKENRLPESQRQKRNSVVQQASQDLFDGKITGKEYRTISKAEMPIRPITRENFPKFPKFKEIVGALTKDKSQKGIVGVNIDIPDGIRVGSRLDIPAYDDFDTWIVSLHDGTKQGGDGNCIRSDYCT